MSIALVINGNGYTVVATDCRATTTETQKSKFGEYQDDARKNLITSFGWTASAGGNLYSANQFNQYIKNLNVLDSEGIFKIWQLIILKTIEISKKHYDSKTCKLIYKNSASSKAVCAINRFMDDKFNTDIEIFDFLHEVRKLDKNTLFVSNPIHKRKVKRAVCKYTKHLKDYKAGRKIVDSLFKVNCGIHEAMYLIACIVADIRKLTPKINDVLDYGISYQIMPGEVVLMSLHGTAQEIKDIYETKGNFSTEMMVCSVLTGGGDNQC